MTKNERTALQNLFNNYSRISEKKDGCFSELQDLCRENGLTVYCSAEANYKQLIKIKELKYKAILLYEAYLNFGGQLEAYEELGHTLAELNFWK